MADMTASGWYPSNTNILYTSIDNAGYKHVLLIHELHATNFGGGAHLYPYSDGGIPPPPASDLGMNRILYIIPMGLINSATINSRMLAWGSRPAVNNGVSGSTATSNVKIHVQVQSGTPSGGPTYMTQAASGTAASTLFTTDACLISMLVVGH
jgi:hypothetical protein